MMLAPMTTVRPTTSPVKSLSAALALALAVTLALGCSTDRHSFRSTPTAPKSVTVSYVQSGDTAWSYDIPVGYQLTLHFDRKGQMSGFRLPDTPATKMTWFISPLTAGQDASGNPRKSNAVEAGEVELSGEPITFSMSLRDAEQADLVADPLDAVPAPPSDAAMENAIEDVEVEEAVEDAVEAEAIEDGMVDEAIEDAADPAMDK